MNNLSVKAELLKALIVDDERLARKELRGLLGEFSCFEIVGEAETVREAARIVREAAPAVVFLDVQLCGETGFDLLDAIETDCKIVFVTAFDAFAIRAFEVNALDYLLKPVDPARLAKTVEKLRGKPERSTSGVLRRLEYDDRIFVELGNRSLFLKISRISHIAAAGDYTEVRTLDKQKFLIEKPLREWEIRLPEKHFARIHRNCIVNLELVERIETRLNNSLRIYLPDQSEPLAVSRRCAARLKTKFA